MNFKEFTESRKSVRGLDKPVPKELVDEIIDAAKWAPTSYNTQTWHIHAVAGDVLNKIREGNIEETILVSLMSETFLIKKNTRVFIDKSNRCCYPAFRGMGIERDDKEKRMDWMLRGFRQFDAPVSLVLTYDKYLEPAAISQFGLGSLAYGIVLAAWERGIGCVINSQRIMQSHVVREHAQIPDDQNIMICIAIGYLTMTSRQTTSAQ